MNVCKIIVKKLELTKQCGNFEGGRMLKIDVHVIVHINFNHFSQKTQSNVL
jgi:hypothetical protein